MNVLSKRLAKLEGSAGDMERPDLILSWAGADGGAEFVTVMDTSGNSISRLETETEGEFLSRARRTLKSVQMGDRQSGTILWACRAGEDLLVKAHASGLGYGEKPLRPQISKEEWLAAHGLSTQEAE